MARSQRRMRRMARRSARRSRPRSKKRSWIKWLLIAVAGFLVWKKWDWIKEKVTGMFGKKA